MLAKQEASKTLYHCKQAGPQTPLALTVLLYRRNCFFKLLLCPFAVQAKLVLAALS